MKRYALFFVLALSVFSAYALNTEQLVSDETAKAILQKKCIRLGTSEILDIDFNIACKTLDQQNLVQAMQDEFRRSISDNGEVDFPVIQTAPTTYFYINEKGKRTDIQELYKKRTDAYCYDYIILAHGKRFFGDYDVIVHLQIIDAAPAGIVYSVNVHAWPHSWLTRSSHKVGLTRSFFKKKMKLISWVAREVGSGLCEQEEQKIELAGVERRLISQTSPQN